MLQSIWKKTAENLSAVKYKATKLKYPSWRFSLHTSVCLKQLHVPSVSQMCPCWLISVHVYRSGNDTHFSAVGAVDAFILSSHTHTHTHTHAQAGGMHAWTCEQTRTSRHVLTQEHTYAAWRWHTQTHILGHFSLWRSSTRSNTHTHTHTHAERGGQMESQRGLLAFHTLETWFLTVFFSFSGPFSSCSSSHLPSFFCTFSFLSAHPRLGFTLSVFFFIWPFYLFSYCRPFHFANNTWQRSIVSSRLFNSQCGKLFLKTLFDFKGIVEGQESSQCDFERRKSLSCPKP